MRSVDKFLGITVAILLSGLLAASWVAAQDQPQTPSLHVLTLQVSAAPAGPPTIGKTPEGWDLFKVNPVGNVTGDLEGAFSQRITQIDPCSDCIEVNQFIPITAFFTIETDEGMLEGYYSGTFYSTEASFPDHLVRVHGQILSVTPAYADLYLADVYYDGIVDFETIDGATIPLGDSGTMIISPR